MSSTFSYQVGSSPVLLSMPHNGIKIPESLQMRMHPFAVNSPDTDWYMDQLYDFANELNLHIIRPYYSRYVIDLNRPIDGQLLYQNANNTELCPLTSFELEDIYLAGQEPQKAEVEQRIEQYWKPYHHQIEKVLSEIKKRYGFAILYDAHSIKSEVPRFFEGRLPDLNLGTSNGESCEPQLEALLVEVAKKSGYSWALNGRFKGGYITRHYGDVANQIYTFQLELSQITYLEQLTNQYQETLALQVKPVLRKFLETILLWGEQFSNS